MALGAGLKRRNLPVAAGPLTLLEIYHTDPNGLPDAATWVTGIAFRLAD